MSSSTISQADAGRRYPPGEPRKPRNRIQQRRRFSPEKKRASLIAMGFTPGPGSVADLEAPLRVRHPELFRKRKA